MPDVESRYDCPVCLGSKLDKLQLGHARHLMLDVCRRCGGIWFDHGEVNRLRGLYPTHLCEKIVLNPSAFKMRCHACHGLTDRNASCCGICGWKNIIDCPVCLKPMTVTTDSDFHLDYCKTCKGVWFDNIELSEIWNGRLDTLAHKHQSEAKGAANDTAAFFIDILAFDPGFAIYGVDTAIEAGQLAVESSVTIVSNVPEVAGAAVEGTCELAGSVFEVIAEIIGGVFSGL